MESLIDFLNYQPFCSEGECGPMDMIGGWRVIHIICIILIAWSLIYTFICGCMRGRDE